MGVDIFFASKHRLSHFFNPPIPTNHQTLSLAGQELVAYAPTKFVGPCRHGIAIDGAEHSLGLPLVTRKLRGKFKPIYHYSDIFQFCQTAGDLGVNLFLFSVLQQAIGDGT